MKIKVCQYVHTSRSLMSIFLAEGDLDKLKVKKSFLGPMKSILRFHKIFLSWFFSNFVLHVIKILFLDLLIILQRFHEIFPLLSIQYFCTILIRKFEWYKRSFLNFIFFLFGNLIWFEFCVCYFCSMFIFNMKYD